ncbi:hypothetical protein [Streptomyces sp. NPDC093225]|uniref:hypothetical protein n=1 Tax=Streptomyces sp. NPDC093225 TaxID=3366034 RepID=UPI0038167999
MSDLGAAAWPQADLDPLRRLKVIAAAVRAPMYAERHYDVPPERLWAVAADLENELPHIIPALKSFTLLGAEGERLTARAVGRLGLPEAFDVVLRPGWCLMQSRTLMGAMAAVPHDGGTTFAFASGLRRPGGALLKRLGLFGTEARGHALLDRLQERIDARSH